jgi:hypothetical protein
MNKLVLSTCPLSFLSNYVFFKQKALIHCKCNIKLVCIVLLFGNLIHVYGQSTYTSVQSGNWNDDATWSGTGTPQAGDNVTIAGEHKITVTANATCASITFQGLAAANSLAAEIIVNNTFTLAVSASITVDSKVSFTNNCIISGAGNLNVASVTIGQAALSPTSARSTAITSSIANFNVSGNLVLNGRGTSPNLNTAYFLHSSGVVKIDGQITANNQSANTTVYDMTSGTQTGTLLLSNTAPFNIVSLTSSIKLNGTGSTVNYTGSGQAVRATSYSNLILSGSGTKTFSGTASSISGNLSISTGVTAALGTGLIHTATTMTLGGAAAAMGLWGSSTATTANFKNDIFFTATTGMVNVGTNICNTQLRVTGVTQCQGDASKALNAGSVISGNKITGSWDVATNPVADRPVAEANGFNNTATCLFLAGTSRSYVATSFQVSVSGNYTFTMDDNTAYDGMGYIYSGNFVPGNCTAGGTFIKGDDNSDLLIIVVLSNEPSMSANLVAGVDYTLISTTAGVSTNASFSWTITPPLLSGGVLIAPSWYTSSSGGTALATNASFNPVGVTNSGLPDTATPGTYAYYVGFNGCRTPVNYVINANPSISGNLNVCVGTITTLSGSGTANATNPWVSATPAVATVSNAGVVTGVAVGTSIITYTNSNGCKITATVTVGARPTVTPAASTVPICAVATATTTTLSYTATGVPTSYSISWNVSPLNSFLAVNDAPITTSPITINVPAGTTAGTYTGTLTIKNANGCTSLGANFNVNINASPILVTTGVIAPVCFKTGGSQTSSMAYSSSSNIVSYSIDWDGSANSAGLVDQGTTADTFLAGAGNVTNILIPANVAPNTYSGVMTITSSNNCTITQAATITINPKPPTPVVGTTTQPTCLSNTGSVQLNGLISPSVWTITQTGTVNNSYNGSGTSFTVLNLVPGNYTFTIQDGTNCPSSATVNVIITASVTNSWNGTSWSKGSPPTNDTDVVQFSGNYQVNEDLRGCACIVNSGVDVVVNSGHTLTIANAVSNNGGSLTFENNASLLQTNTVANTGNITYKRTTTPVRRYDFTFWSSPVTRTPSFKLHDLSPDTLGDKYYKFDPVTGWIIIYNGEEAMEAGRGYIIRAPQNYDITEPKVYEGKFVGVPNNGTFLIPLAAAEKSYLLGNPYPSAIYADQFIVDNSANLYGTLYFWTHNSPPSDQVDGDGRYNYTTSDYAIYNLTGSLDIGHLTGDGATTPGNQAAPLGYIAAGQSFFVKSKTTQNAVFTNSMRVPGNNSQFFKTGNVNKEKATGHRVWLNLTNTQGAFKQLLIGYVEGATNSWDNNYDGLTMDGNKYLDFYSINNFMKLVIQGRALPFDETDTVPLGYRSIIAGEFTIAIDHANGDLSSHVIYLEDKLTNSLHDLKTSDYTFTTAIGTFDNRFVLRYAKPAALGTDEFNTVKQVVFVAVEAKMIKVISTKENIKEVSIYDVTGKLLYTKNKVNATELHVANLQSTNQVVLVKTTLESGAVTSVKTILK